MRADHDAGLKSDNGRGVDHQFLSGGGEQHLAKRICCRTVTFWFVRVRQRGSQRQSRDSSERSITVPFHSGRDIAPTLLRQIAK